jgi:ceramide glucosyltransferase
LNLELASRVAALPAWLSFGLTLWRWAASARFPLHRRTDAPPPPPGCTLLKPLKGCDAETKSCLRSWLTQDYPGRRQILFGVDSADDPVCAVARELLAEFPQADAQLVVCGQDLGVNKKLSTLRQLEPLIRHPLVIISDADVGVPADFLANVAPLFADEEVGLVSCFYRLANPANLAMRWEDIAINADFWSAALQARTLGKVDFALGAVMALPRARLREIGGFAALADYLADDYQLGREVARLGKRIVFSTVVVDCHEPTRNWAQVWAHQVRWARTIRVCQPALFFFSVLENATLWPLLWLGVNAGSLFTVKDTVWRSATSIMVSSQIQFSPVVWICAVFFAFRIGTALQQEWRLTGSSGHFGYFWMVPVKDLLNSAVWAGAFAGNQVQWRGHRYRILAGGKLEKVG